MLREIKAEGEVLTGEVLADYVNQYFVNAAITVTTGLPQTQGFICLAGRTRDSCFFGPTNWNEVCRVIMNLKNRGSKLLDIHPSILKENRDIFSVHFVDFYNLSLELQEFPSALKIARVNPGYKSGSPDKIDNYRPISSLPLFSKVFEKLTLIRMDNFISRHNLLTPSQFGFRKGCSTTHAIVKLLSHVVQACHRKQYSGCFFLDLKKAFDTIDHKILGSVLRPDRGCRTAFPAGRGRRDRSRRSAAARAAPGAAHRAGAGREQDRGTRGGGD